MEKEEEASIGDAYQCRWEEETFGLQTPDPGIMPDYKATEMPTKRKTNSVVCDLNGKAENKGELGSVNHTQRISTVAWV